MSQTNPYEAPASDLNQPSAAGDHPLNPNWQIGSVLSEAWELTNGFKATMWGAFLLYMAVVFGVSIVGGIVTAGAAALSATTSIILMVVVQLAQLLVSAPLGAGLFMIGIKRASGQPVSAFMVFDYFPKTLPLFFAYLLMMVLIAIGFVLLVIPGIYLMIAYALALPLLVNKNLGIWDALETSRKGITPCWFRFFGFGLLAILIAIIASLPLFIGLIWVLPWLYVAVGIIYRDLFGVNVN